MEWPPATSFQDDFEKLMVYLFSDETELNAVYKRASQLAQEQLNRLSVKWILLKIVGKNSTSSGINYWWIGEYKLV